MIVLPVSASFMPFLQNSAYIKHFKKKQEWGKVGGGTLRGASSKQLSSYLDMNLENSNSDAIVIHVGLNDLLIGKCQFYAIKILFISGLVHTNMIFLMIKRATWVT